MIQSGATRSFGSASDAEAADAKEEWLVYGTPFPPMVERRKSTRSGDRRKSDRKTRLPVREDERVVARERLTVKLPGELIDHLRDAVYYTDGITITSVLEDSIRAHIARLEKQRGAAFPKRLEDLRPGRPRR